MSEQPPAVRRQSSTAVVAVLLLFVTVLTLIGTVGRRASGFDLASSYVGCRLFVNHSAEHLYSTDFSTFNITPDDAWKSIGAGDPVLSRMPSLPPYVQIPLWGYSLQPLCKTTGFTGFHRFFALVTAACFAAILWLTSRFWVPRLFHPLWIAVLSAAWLLTDPLVYAVSLTQTHVIFLTLCLVAIICAERGWEWSAGALAGLAAAVKVTPFILAVYWMITGRRKAALSLLGTLAFLMGLSYSLTGEQVMHAYVQSMSRMSNMLLVAFNNQSLAAWWEAREASGAEVSRWHAFTLPHWLKVLCSALLLLLSGIAGGLLDRRLQRRGTKTPPYGAVLTLVAATMVTPIAWSHYYILLIVPAMLVLDDYLGRRSRLSLVLLAAMVLPNFYYLVRSHAFGLHLPVLIRKEFYEGVAALLALWVASYHALSPSQTESQTI